MQKNPILLLILDGFGHSDKLENNAISNANTPNLDMLLKKYPNSLINASESHVGLPKGQMGNSEVGHLNIGAGRVISQDLERINTSIRSGIFYKNSVLEEIFKKLSLNNYALHIFGLLSDGGVHSHIDHFKAMVEFAKKKKVKKVYIHAFLDGRDTPPKSAEKFILTMEKNFKEIGVGELASISGRFYSMDRDNRWDRIKSTFDLVMHGKANFSANTALDALNDGYLRGETDEFLSPTSIDNSSSKNGIDEGDSIIFMNFRSDRARQLTDAILNKEFEHFDRGELPRKFDYFTLTNYDKNQKKAKTIFEPIIVKDTLGQFLSNLGKTQLRIAETEKYPHVTFFFNGGEENKYKGEDRIMIPSPKVETYDLKPEMSAYEVTEKLETAIISQGYDVIICNYANSDMVGHTGNLEAATKAIEVLDECIGNIYHSILKVKGQMIITADHGNAEQMIDIVNNQKHTQHTTNLVPFIYVGKKAKIKDNGKLSDIAPTIICLMDQKPPSLMTGRNLIELDE